MAMSLRPERLYLQALASFSSVSGARASVEVGLKPLPPLTFFARGDWTPREWVTGVGARLTF